MLATPIGSTGGELVSIVIYLPFLGVVLQVIDSDLGQAGLDLLKDFANVDYSYNLSSEELYTKISLCDALIVRSGTKVTHEVFESSAGRLKVVGKAGVGIDNVDLAATTEHWCLVVNAPIANTVAAAEHGIALLASVAKNAAQAAHQVWRFLLLTHDGNGGGGRDLSN
ncbi:D-3-phosphoglycerate dehydrogenase 3, chloroplastic [Turnera subulata]|uniref:D-3-phosphoglycerate dehydrogenase 3, chloroplastic n=1 Tax=Turnera subulata TaxID=218843 RepID=A0A9Q0FRS5_9ROSI|nr:D-3-phosphoglycerate dehydrogenase 3, chloroplastic [Turnera subulata]